MLLAELACLTETALFPDGQRKSGSGPVHSPSQWIGLDSGGARHFTIWNVAGEADRVAWLTASQWAGLAQPMRRALLYTQVRHRRGNVPLGQHYADLLPALKRGRFLSRPEPLTPTVLNRLFAGGAAPASMAGCRRRCVTAPRHCCRVFRNWREHLLQKARLATALVLSWEQQA